VADFVVVVGVVDRGVVVVVVLVDLAEEVDAAGDVVAVVDDDGTVCEVTVAALLDPGCSLATRTPMSAVEAVAATTAVCVTRRNRTRVR
jgi:hypothetical protein